jgi:hypothetical protein
MSLHQEDPLFHSRVSRSQTPRVLVLTGIALGAALLSTRAVLAQAASAGAASAVERMQAPGPEEERLRRTVGTWEVTSTIRVTPEAAPIVSTGLVAERTMVGLYLQEVMRPGPGSRTPDFRRISYLYFSRVEGRWQYVSIDTRFPVGIMPARSFDRQAEDTLRLEFEPLAFVGLGREVEGRMIRSTYEVTREGDDHEFARQYWVQSDGSGRKWLAVEYEYRRKR